MRFIYLYDYVGAMVSGVLTVIGCPILEDELLYSIRNDGDEKDVYLIENDSCKSLKAKFVRYGVPFISVDESTVMGKIETLDPSRYSIVIKMLDMALHAEPKDLKAKVEEEIRTFSDASDSVALYYGLCGNFGWDVSVWAENNNLCPVSVFRDAEGRVCDDCIGVAVGGPDNYRKLLRAHTGEMLFTPGVATNWNDFLAASEMFKGMPPGSEKSYMKWIFDICDYDTVVKIDTGLGDREELDYHTKEFADEYGFRVIEAEDTWPCIDPAVRIYEEAKSYLA